MVALPEYFIKQVEAALEETQTIPLWGSPPPFPWDEVAAHLAHALHLEGLTLKAKGTSFLEDITAGMGENPTLLSFNLIPLPGAVHFMMAMEEIARLSMLLLQNKQFSDPRFQEGFYRYLCLRSVAVVDQLNAFEDLSLAPTQAPPPPKTGALCVDIAIGAHEQTLWGRLAVPADILHAFKSHFSLKRASVFSNPLAPHLDLTLRLHVGATHLPLAEWKEVKVGDFVVLDRCSFHPETQKGSVEIMLGETPLFRARLKGGMVKILEYAFYYEEEAFMEEGDVEPEEGIEPEQPAEEPPLPDFDTVISTNEIPLTLIVEVGRVHMNLEKLLELRPGNTLELPGGAERGVDLTLNGKRVAKAELIRLGDALGVKILALGV